MYNVDVLKYLVVDVLKDVSAITEQSRKYFHLVDRLLYVSMSGTAVYPSGLGRNHLYKEFRSCEIRKQQIERDKLQLLNELETVSARMADIEAALILIPSAKRVENSIRQNVSHDFFLIESSKVDVKSNLTSSIRQLSDGASDRINEVFDDSGDDDEDKKRRRVEIDDALKSNPTKKLKLTDTIEYTLTLNENKFWAETIENQEKKNGYLNTDTNAEKNSSSSYQKKDEIQTEDILEDALLSSSSSSSEAVTVLDSSKKGCIGEEGIDRDDKIKMKKRRKNRPVPNPNNLSRNVPMGPLDEESLFCFDKRCLLRYLELHGDMRVRHSFEIPWVNNWSEEMWGYKLGNQTRLIRESHIHTDKRDELIDIGFSYKKLLAREGYGWDRIKSSLLQYKALFGDLLVHRDFVVPNNHPDWPQNTWGIRLGSRVHHLRNRGDHADKRNELLEMGFMFRVSKLSKFAIQPI